MICTPHQILFCGDQIENKEIGRACSMFGGGGAYSVWVGRPEGKRSVGRPRHRREDNIKMDLQEVGWWVWTRFI